MPSVIEKVVDNEQLMERMRYEPIIYVRSSKNFKIAWKGKNAWEDITSPLGIDIYCISTHKANTARTSFMKQKSSIWNREDK